MGLTLFNRADRNKCATLMLAINIKFIDAFTNAQVYDPLHWRIKDLHPEYESSEYVDVSDYHRTLLNFLLTLHFLFIYFCGVKIVAFMQAIHFFV